MINSIELKNFGPIKELEWKNLSKINLIIGNNGVGKSFLLKALYTTLRTLETYKRGDDQRELWEILYDKLYWTFQPDSIGGLVKKGSDNTLSLKASLDNQKFSYSFGKKTTKHISVENETSSPRNSNSVFLPAKEVLSLHSIILRTRDRDLSFGFDDTYVDLIRALMQAPITQERNYSQFTSSRSQLEKMLGGKVEYNSEIQRWLFKKGNQKFPMGVTAEGIKKISIFDTLLGNGYLDENSIIFIDEPESALHPKAISQLLNIIYDLSESGMQFFLASHSYFVVTKLYILAQEKGVSIPILSLIDKKPEVSELKEGLPENPIIRESIRLYEQEIELLK